MIQVSNEFKKAIKSPERRIKGYVEVLYDLPSVTITPTTNMTSSYTNLSEIINGKRVSNNYGTLDYLPLDGSVLAMSEENINSGFISDDLAGEINNATITLNFSETTINGITIYYEDNFPENVYYTLSDGTTGYFIGKEIQQATFDSPKTITSITLNYNLWRYEDRKIRINEVDLGITQVYKDQDLIEFTVDEEVNKLVEEVPVNETNVILNNMGDLFNPLNPTGIVPYLSENTLIKPYVGVLTESLGVEYVKMGEFYFDSYTNNSGATTTLVGKNILKQIEQENLEQISGGQVYLQGYEIPSEKINSILSNYKRNNHPKYNTNILDNYSNNFHLSLSGDLENSLIRIFKETAFRQSMVFYSDRNNELNIKTINNILKDTLTKSDLINDVEYKKIDKINSLEIETNNISASDIESGTFNVYENSFTLNATEQIYFIKFNQICYTYNFNITRTGGTSASLVDSNAFVGFLKINGNVGETVKIIISCDTIINSKSKKYDVNKKTNENLVSLKYSPEVFITEDTNRNLFERLYNIAPSYEMSFEYNGDPSLEAGDYINVETPYGYKPLFIQKNRIKFDGGLEGSIEGVE